MIPTSTASVSLLCAFLLISHVDATTSNFAVLSYYNTSDCSGDVVDVDEADVQDTCRKENYATSDCCFNGIWKKVTCNSTAVQITRYNDSSCTTVVYPESYADQYTDADLTCRGMYSGSGKPDTFHQKWTCSVSKSSIAYWSFNESTCNKSSSFYTLGYVVADECYASYSSSSAASRYLKSFVDPANSSQFHYVTYAIGDSTCSNTSAAVAFTNYSFDTCIPAGNSYMWFDSPSSSTSGSGSDSSSTDSTEAEASPGFPMMRIPLMALAVVLGLVVTGI
jgi:hypothetical protein